MRVKVQGRVFLTADFLDPYEKFLVLSANSGILSSSIKERPVNSHFIREPYEKKEKG